MPVRCGCGEVVSEWAARCARCGGDVTGLPLVEGAATGGRPEEAAAPAVSIAAASPVAVPLPAPAPAAPVTGPPGQAEGAAPAPLSTPLPPAPDGPGGGAPGRSRRAPGWHRGLDLLRRPWAAAAAGALVAGALATVGFTGSAHGNAVVPPPTVPAPVVVRALPADLGSVIGVYTDTDDPRFAPPGGPVGADLAAIAAAALPASEPVPAGPGAIVYLGTGKRAGRAVFVGRSSGLGPLERESSATVDLGPADRVVYAPPGEIGLALEGADGSYYLRQLDVSTGAGDPVVTFARSVTLPPGNVPVALLPGGAVAVRTVDDHLVVRGAKGHSGDLGGLRSVLGVSGSTLAWTGSAGCDPEGNCPLHLLDVASGQLKTAATPVGASGFAAGGAFSPSGTAFAAFAAPATRVGSSFTDVEPVLVDIRDASSVVIGPPQPTRMVQGVPVGIAWWSGDGSWVISCGLLGSVRAASADGGAEATFDLDLPASYAFAAI